MSKAVDKPSVNMDPILFEILRHRLTTIVDEAAAALASASGSPSVAQSNDCNVALLTASGEGVIMGKAMATHAMGCIQTTRYVIDHFQDNPGIREGDMFLTNHPYIGTPHQPCTVMVAPLFHEGKLIAWAGAGNHMGDVGGRIPGQVAIGAQSIWDEAVPVPPIRIVEGGVLRRDLEEEFLTRTRTRAQNALDLKAMIGANNAIRTRIEQMIARYSAAEVTTAMDEVITTSERKLRAILARIPDGTWSSTSYIDYYDQELRTYECVLKTTKTGEDIVFDFSASSPQAPAVINATYVATEGFVFRAVLSMFGFVISHCPAAIQRVVRVKTKKGTIIDCAWPAGVCKGTTSSTQAVLQVSISTLSQMLMGSEEYRGRAMAVSRGHLLMLDSFGQDQYGEPFAAVFQDCAQGAGSGAFSTRDGMDTGGVTDPNVGVPNVENTELRYPVLYLYRRQEPDSGGPGKFRGGVGLTMAMVPHDVPVISDLMIHSHGVTAPSAQGLSGGLPGGRNRITIKRDTNVAALLAKGVVPTSPDDLSGRLETPPSFTHTRLAAADILICEGSGGGGYGDPLERDPAAVAADVANLVVTVPAARDRYGVALRDGSVDGGATERLRATQRDARRDGVPSQSAADRRRPAARARRINEYLAVGGEGAASEVVCSCGHRLGAADSFRTRLATRTVSTSEPSAGDGGRDETVRLVLVERTCPSCHTLVEAEVLFERTPARG